MFRNRLSRLSSMLLCLLSFGRTLYGDTFKVLNTADSGPGSLRQAMLDADAHTGPDLIVFNIPATDPHYDATIGVWSIRPVEQLPVLYHPATIIDGNSQALFIGRDTNPFGPEIEIDGSLSPYRTSGIRIQTDGVEVLSLTINRFKEGSGISFDKSNGGRVAGCYVGVDPTGMKAASNGYGISLYKSSHINLQPDHGIPNIVSGNPVAGITITDSSYHNEVSGNIVGLNRTASDTIGNSYYGGYGGVRISTRSDSNTIVNNLIGGNKRVGVYLFSASDNLIADNYIGTDRKWMRKFPNVSGGISIKSDAADLPLTRSTGNRIVNNYIGNHSYYGIAIENQASYYNTISANIISNNGNLGILLSDGANRAVEAPIITSISTDRISGNSRPRCRIEIFNDKAREGRLYLGSTQTDINGVFSLATTGFPPLPYVTATATDPDGNTSWFSQPLATGVQTESHESLGMISQLEQNYPNPFNAGATIGFTLAKRGRTRISLFDIQGRCIGMILDEELPPGERSFHIDASELPSGVYFYRLEQAGLVLSRKFMVLK
ncbi:MAG TPA: right-handed parallel beta-helix repeat-containing protein [bacterium]|nr:right-handed parallel beta-helix repeat-containing protein [bacterium]HQI48127.1 right-handed parallel beta-helix repeat-containing protein [bacterium]HQJ65843.1 right-handed parallel beta-helix repeat-containing protein [bacterium]